MATAILTGSYNEYGYVIRKKSRIIYAAGNCQGDSQAYIGSMVDKKGTYQKTPLDEDDVNILLLEEIQTFCNWMIEEMCRHPDWHNLKDECTKGSISYAKDLNPLEAAHKCRALTK
jgi:hypothetical protein